MVHSAVCIIHGTPRHCCFDVGSASRTLGQHQTNTAIGWFNPFNPDFTLSSSSTTSRELLSQFSTCSGWRWFEVGEKIKDNYHVLVNQFHGNFHSKTLGCRKIKCVFRDVKWCFNASWRLKGLTIGVLTYFIQTKRTKVFAIWNHHKCLSFFQRFLLYFNMLVMGLRQLYICYSFRNEMNRALGHLCTHIG